jgi:hypothetical protein
MKLPGPLLAGGKMRTFGCGIFGLFGFFLDIFSGIPVRPPEGKDPITPGIPSE